MTHPPAFRSDATPRLAPPGAGIPAYQMWAGKHIFLPWWCLRVTPRRVPDVMDRQGRRILHLGEDLSAADRERRVLVPPQIGLEDSSRFHSWAMVVEHLTIIGDALARVLTALTHGRVPPGEVSTADFKPRGGRPAGEIVEEYRAMLGRFRRTVLEECGDWRSPTRFGHPWFGPLVARQWVRFGPFHQTIHITQARRIRRRIRRDPAGRAGPPA